MARLVLVHGFTQTARCWAPVDDGLAADHEVVTVDAPGHGTKSAVRADLWAGARLLAEEAGPGAWLGYSMGGRLALHVALARPDVVDRLILVGATGGIDEEAERVARVAADEDLARRLEEEGVDRFLDSWLAHPLFAGLPPEAAHLDERRTNTAAGLASSLRLAGTGRQEPLWERLAAVDIPVLVVAGALDAKFAALGERLVACIGSNASLALVPGAGHTAHLERPEAFLSIAGDWLG